MLYLYLWFVPSLVRSCLPYNLEPSAADPRVFSILFTVDPGSNVGCVSACSKLDRLASCNNHVTGLFFPPSCRGARPWRCWCIPIVDSRFLRRVARLLVMSRLEMGRRVVTVAVYMRRACVCVGTSLRRDDSTRPHCDVPRSFGVRAARFDVERLRSVYAPGE